MYQQASKSRTAVAAWGGTTRFADDTSRFWGRGFGRVQ
jgi:hypothetical protein